MVTYQQNKGRHAFSMNRDDLAIFAELFWLLHHTPPPAGFNRRPFTGKQSKMIEDIHDLIVYPDNYDETMNKKNGQ